jgi:hypothetical protein
MIKQKTKKTKRSPIDCENSVPQVTRSKQKISSKQALFLWKFSTQLSEPPSNSSTQARKRQKGCSNWTLRGHESAAWRRSRTTIATQKNKSVDAQNLMEERSCSRFFFLPLCPERLLARFSAVGLASGHQNRVFVPPAPFPWPGF